MDLENLFSRGMRDILRTRIGTYPLYVYCFNDILNKGLLARMESEHSLGYDYGRIGAVSVSPNARKIRPYLRSLFKGISYAGSVDVLFVSRHRPVDIAGAKNFTTDYLFGPVIDALCGKDGELSMALVNVGGHRQHYADDRVKNFGLFELVSFSIMLRSAFWSLLLHLRYRRMAGKLAFDQKRMFDGFFSFRNLLFCHLLDFCLGKAVDDLSPRVIVANDDVMVFKPCTGVDTKLIALQSASIAEQNERYRNLLFSSFLDDSLLSDYFCVSGPKSESLKQEFLKDTKKIVITGQPRFDNLAHVDKFFDRNAIRRKFGLTTEGKILLWVTDSGVPLEEKTRAISAVYKTVSSLKDVRLVVKPHPAEDQILAYTRNNIGNPVVIGGSASLSELLFVCDAMITKASTAVLEAALLRKPVVVFNLSGKPDIMPYVERGVAIGVYREEDLASAIQEALWDKETRERLAENQQRFAYEYTYLQDGKASERVAELIKESVGVSGK